MAKRISIAVVDDHPVVRMGIAQTFAEQRDIEIVGEGGSADDAVKIAREDKPDLFVLDVTMPGGGVEAVPRILDVDPDAKILMLSIREDLSVVRAALKAGASGYVSKGVDADELVSAARKVLDGVRYISPELAVRLIAGEEEKAAAPRPTKGNLPPLTVRENEILNSLAEGLSNQEIADRIGLSENTVKHYLTPLLSKLGVRNRTEAALLVRKSKGAAG